MTTTYLEIQSRQRQRTFVLIVAVFGVYFLIVLGFVVLARFVGGFMSVGPRAPTLLDLESVGTALALGFGLVATQVWFARTHAVRSVLDALGAQAPDPSDRYHRRLTNLVEEMAVAAGRAGQVRAVVAPSMALSAFAAEDARSGAVVGVTEGLLSRLSRAQTQAVVAHEMAHVRDGDARLTAITCALLAPFAALAEIVDKIDDFLSDQKDAPLEGPGAGVLVGLVTVLMRLICTTISRERELQADAGAVELTRNPLALAEALHAVAHRHHFLGSRAAAFSPIFVVDPTTSALSEGEGWFSNLFSTHPSVSKRLDLLLQMAHAGPEILAKSRSSVRAGVAQDREAGQVGANALETATLPAGTACVSPSTGALPIAVDTPPLRWRLARGEAWTEPLAFDDLVRQEGFGPDAWIVPEGGDKPGLVRTDSRLLAAMRREPWKWAKSTPAPAGDLSLGTPGSSLVASAPAPAGDCPHCLVPLRREEYEGVPVDSCVECRGLFVGEGHVRRILARREAVFAPEFRAKIAEWAAQNNIRRDVDLSAGSPASFGALLCPRCGQPLVRRFYSYQYAIVVDRCYSCAAIWFDREEIEMLQVLLEATDEN